MQLLPSTCLLVAPEQVNSHLPILFWHLQRTQSDSGSSIHMPAPPALCLRSVQKQEHEKSITEGYQRAEIIIICIISEFGRQPSPDPSLPGNNKYLCEERSLKRTTTKHRMNAIKKTRGLVNISLIPLEWVGKVKGSLKNRKEKAWQRCEGHTRVNHVWEVGKVIIPDKDTWATALILFVHLFVFNLFQTAIHRTIPSFLSIFHVFFLFVKYFCY